MDAHINLSERNARRPKQQGILQPFTPADKGQYQKNRRRKMIGRVARCKTVTNTATHQQFDFRFNIFVIARTQPRNRIFDQSAADNIRRSDG